MLENVIQKENPQYTPTFESNDIVVLKEDCSSYSFFKELEEKFLKQGRLCRIVKCGYHYIYVDDSRGESFVGYVETQECQWCLLDMLTNPKEYDAEELEHRFLDEDFLVSAMVKASNLRLANENDV